MKKSLLAVTVLLMAVMLSVSCDGNAKEPENSSYTVQFDLAGGEGYIPEQDVRKDGKIAEIEKPVKEGYVLTGWKNTADDSDFDIENDKVTSNLRLKAVWTPVYTVSFDSAGGTPATYEAKTVLHGNLISEVPEDPERKNYVFQGWYDGDEKVDLTTLKITKNLSLKAVWKRLFTVIFNLDGGEGETDFRHILEGEKITGLRNPEKQGSYFAGWVNAYDGTAFNMITDTVKSDLALKAVWKTSFAVGETGPAGGIIIRDEGAEKTVTYKDIDGKEVSYTWRYLEAAPCDITITDGGETRNTFIFGFFRSGGIKTVGDTSVEIGKGRANTRRLVSYMGNTTAADAMGSKTTSDYAARLCDIYGDGSGFDDWFLPSSEELKLFKEVLCDTGKGDISSEWYWSSTEDYADNQQQYAFAVNPDVGSENNYLRSKLFRVRPVRAF